MPNVDTLALEKAIAVKPGTNSSTASQSLTVRISAMENMLLINLRLWLVKQGLPVNSVKAATITSIVNAYNSRPYLLSWRNRVNPSWALLGGDIDEEEATTDEANHTPTASANELTDQANGLEPTAPASNTPSAPTSQQTEAWLKALYAQINKSVEALVADKLAKTTLKLDDNAKQQIKQLAQDAASAKVAELAPPRQIEVVDNARGTVVSLGLQHERFPTLLRAIQAVDHRNFRLNIWLTGPTGSGKTSACESAAKALDLPFGSDGSLDADYKVLGFRDANGNIVSTQFLQIYENGGIYVADEIDNWLPSALLSLNAALANGWVSSPRGMIKRHKDACVIACANTWGLGATGDYVGRTRLDAASLDRFQPKINWLYDERMELTIAHNLDATNGFDWFETVRKARAKAAAQGLKIIISPRATYNGISLLKAGFEWDEVVDMTICAGISSEQKKALAISPRYIASPDGEQAIHSYSGYGAIAPTSRRY